MNYTREDSERLNKLGLEFLIIMKQNRGGVEDNDRTDRQVEIVNEIIEKMQPGIESIASGLLNGKGYGFCEGQGFYLEKHSLNEFQLEYGDLVNAGNVFVIERFGHYNPLRAGVSTFVMKKSVEGMFNYALENNPPGYKSGINTKRAKILRKKKDEKFPPTNLSFDKIINPDNENPFDRRLEAQYFTRFVRQDETIFLAEMICVMKKHLVGLNPREERIIRQRFGVGVDREYTLEEIGSELGISRERVRQIQKKGLKKIKKSLHLIDLRMFI